MSALRVIGIDPGPIPGFVMLDYAAGVATVDVVQCSWRTASTVLLALLEDRPVAVTVQIEQFVVGRRSSRSSTASAGAITRDLIGSLQTVWADHDATPNGRLGGHWFVRNAAAVKPWATDARLDAAGLLEATKGMRHARDAARHALYAAVHDGGMSDPLSKAARS